MLSSKPASEERAILGVTKEQQANSLMSEMANKAVESQSKNIVLSSLQKQFKDPAVIAGILGNIDVETGGTFSHTQKEKGGNGVGLFQFTYQPMKDAYKKYLESTKSKDSVDSQIAFINSAMTTDKHYDIGAGNRNKLNKAISTGDPAVIATAFSNLVEKPGVPHLDRRILSARQHFEQLRRR